MRRVRGFDDQILDALKSGDREIEYEAATVDVRGLVLRVEWDPSSADI
jgi:hypothetical protein